MLSVEAEVPDVEVTQHDIAFAGVPNAAPWAICRPA